jgi:hypothetical protein
LVYKYIEEQPHKYLNMVLSGREYVKSNSRI